MATHRKVLIIGGGITGMCTAIQLRKLQYDVELVEIDPNWRIDGAGITISGPTLRAFKEVGVIADIMEQGACTDNLTIGLANGQVVAQIPTQRVAGPDIPGTGGILRPVLAQILAKATRASGATVRLGLTYTAIEQSNGKVHVTFTDGTSSTYDLVVAADGVTSKTRSLLLPHLPKPEFTGQGSWRAVVPRPAEIQNASFYISKTTKAGINPVSKTEMYLFCLQRMETDEFIPKETWPARLAALLSDFSGVVGQIRDGLNEHSHILYRPLHKLMVAAPWHVGNIVFVGDTMHATTPHLASGAGIGVEDAIVLAQELDRHENIVDAFTAFASRRYERCKLVVDSSVKLGVLENLGTEDAKQEHTQLMMKAVQALAAPI
ncbi:FAD-dependent oxidoreductase [Noviherbaspirillum sp. Root189]|uniref:FAD-dependent oxidoreductase n=1 Tax=Noviherbaspirillum sp. Root189 TaxID=1736487 RepID=UPI00070A569C|nr:FAD-dependent oxidoreductase [Noviherbaspirillum sp. Root189]KRB93539.1 hypothetical protein ASE07_12645 [Noviherbaspirillum sp. Root189]